MTCQFAGTTYQLGEHFACECNSCLCTPQGVVGTAVACSNQCTYNGQSHPPFELFPSRDGCNQCSCGWTGARCGTEPCTCKPDTEWWRNYVSKSAGACKAIDYECPVNTKPFSNDCGCGCEESDECGEWVDCSPGVGSCDWMKTSCPLSKVAE